MKKCEMEQAALALAERLGQIDYQKLPISDYNKQYIGRLKPALSYYMLIYADCLYRGTALARTPLSSLTFVDYGGGSGFLSILAKELGVGKIIYIDLNPQSVETIRILKKETGLGPDVILHGDSSKLAEWCKTEKVIPGLLVATDLIEHVYRLDAFFEDLMQVNNEMQMIFTTASSPFNPYVKWKLRRLMKGCETGSLESPNYYTQRKQFIRENYPRFSTAEIELWSRKSRGMTFDDLRQAIRQNALPEPEDPYNTCDPTTGNWTERILPVRVYKSLAPSGYSLHIKKGFYNEKRTHPILGWICKGINFLIRHTGKAGLGFAPFILLLYTRERK